MRRILLPMVAAALLLCGSATIALGAKPLRSCPASPSGYFLVDVDAWWAETVEGFEAEGIPVYEADGVTYTAAFDAFAAAFGLVDGAALEAFVRGPQWETIDRDGNGWACMKPRHASSGNGNPAYFFNGIDDSSASKG